jgi:hypothetical protein
VAPAHEVGIEAGPRGALVGKDGDDAGGAALLDGEPVNRAERAVGEHELAAHVLALVGGGVGAGADVDELGGDVGVLAVVGERHGLLGEVGEDAARRRELLEPALGRAPAEVALEVGVGGLAVGGEGLDLGIGEPAALELAGEPVGRGAQPRRALDAVVAAERPHGAEDVRTVDAPLDHGRHGVGPERDPAGLGAGRCREGQGEQQGHESHARELTRRRRADAGASVRSADGGTARRSST